MMLIPAGVKVHLALGYTDLRKGIDGLGAMVERVLEQDPFSGHLFVFRGKRPHFTSFSIPIAICCGGVPLASASWSASSRLRPTGACRPSDPLR
jgi:hypothetical protein